MRVGVVGTGHWARVVHAAGAAAHPDVDLVAVWGRDRAKAEAIAADHAAVGLDDLDEMLDAVDILTVAVPPHVQAEVALRAAQAGTHLLLEKPISTDLAAADQLVAAVDRSGVSTVVFFTQRFVPVWERWLAGFEAGAVLGGRAEWLGARFEPDSPYAGSVWRREEGALWDVGPHALSQLLPVLGPVVDVAGVRGHGDLVHLALRHAGGATSTLALSLTMPAAAARVGVELYDERGWHTRPEEERDVAAAYATALSELVANAAAGVPHHRCDVRFGREVVEVLSRCRAALVP